MEFRATTPEVYFQGRVDHLLHCSFLSDLFRKRLLAAIDHIDRNRNYVLVVPAASLLSIDTSNWQDAGMADTGFHHFERPRQEAGDGPVSVRLAYMDGLVFMAVEHAGPERGIHPLQDEAITDGYWPESHMMLLQKMWDTYDSLGLLLWLYPADLSETELPPNSLLESWAVQLSAVHGALCISIVGAGADYLNRETTEVAQDDEYTRAKCIDDIYHVLDLLDKTDHLLADIPRAQTIEDKISLWVQYRDEVHSLRAKMERSMHFMKTSFYAFHEYQLRDGLGGLGM